MMIQQGHFPRRFANSLTAMNPLGQTPTDIYDIDTFDNHQNFHGFPKNN